MINWTAANPLIPVQTIAQWQSHIYIVIYYLSTFSTSFSLCGLGTCFLLKKEGAPGASQRRTSQTTLMKKLFSTLASYSPLWAVLPAASASRLLQHGYIYNDKCLQPAGTIPHDKAQWAPLGQWGMHMTITAPATSPLPAAHALIVSIYFPWCRCLDI